MSYLSDEMDRLLEKHHQSVDDVAAKCGINRGVLYLWKRGQQTSISEEQLSLLAPALSSEILDQAALVLAHLRDEKFGPGSELVEVSLVNPELNDRPAARSPGERAIAFLAQERIANADLNELLLDLARVLGGREVLEAPPKPTATKPRGPKPRKRFVEVPSASATFHYPPAKRPA